MGTGLEGSTDMNSDGRADPKTVIDTIFSIAPILPGQQRQSAQSSQPSQSSQPPQATQSKPQPPPPQLQPQHTPVQSKPQQSLLDLDETSKPDPIAGNPLHPTSNPKQIIPQEANNLQATPVHQATTTAAPIGNAPKTSPTLMDDQLNNQMSNMTMQPLTPTAGRDRPIKRTDTETSDVEVFVDAEG